MKLLLPIIGGLLAAVAALVLYRFVADDGDEPVLNTPTAITDANGLGEGHVPGQIPRGNKSGPAGLTEDSRSGSGDAPGTASAIEAGGMDASDTESRVHVEVVSEGRPVANAEVFSVRADSSGRTDGPMVLVGTTNRHGVVVGEMPPSGYQLAASAPGFASSESVSLDESGRAVIELQRAHALKIRFVDEAGKPISGVSATLCRSSLPKGPHPSPHAAAAGAQFDDLDYRTITAISDSKGMVELTSLTAGLTTLHVYHDRYVATTGHLSAEITIPAGPMTITLSELMVAGFRFEGGARVPFSMERPPTVGGRARPSQKESDLWGELMDAWDDSVFVVMPLAPKAPRVLKVDYLIGSETKSVEIPFVPASRFVEPTMISLEGEALRDVELVFQLPSGERLADFDQFRVRDRKTEKLVSHGDSSRLRLPDGDYYVELTTVLTSTYKDRTAFKVSGETTQVICNFKKDIWRVPLRVLCADGPRMRLTIRATSPQDSHRGTAYVFGERFDVWLTTAGDYTVTVVAPGYRAEPVKVSFEDQRWRDEPVTVELMRNR